MRIQHRFIFFFLSYVLICVIITALIGVLLIHRLTDTISASPNPAFLPIVSSKVFMNSLFVYGTFLIIMICISLPAGFILLRMVSGTYMDMFKRVSSLAKERFLIDSKSPLPGSDSHLVRRYMEQLINDVQNLKEFEKNKSWADGAQMLLHELKNPMTPLKLSIQQLLLDDALCEREEIKRIATSLSDMEKITGYFKELVTIDFGQKELFDLKTFFLDVISESTINFGGVAYQGLDLLSHFQITSEKTLLKMLFVNLIKNGIEANRDGFLIEIHKALKGVDILFITKDRVIQDTSKLYKLGYSTKGTARGFGLFLCKRISDYLDLNLRILNDYTSVTFAISFNVDNFSIADNQKILIMER